MKLRIGDEIHYRSHSVDFNGTVSAIHHGKYVIKWYLLDGTFHAETDPDSDELDRWRVKGWITLSETSRIINTLLKYEH